MDRLPDRIDTVRDDLGPAYDRVKSAARREAAILEDKRRSGVDHERIMEQVDIAAETATTRMYSAILAQYDIGQGDADAYREAFTAACTLSAPIHRELERRALGTGTT